MQIMIKLGDPLWRKIGTRRLSLEFQEDHITMAKALQYLRERYPQVRDDLDPERNLRSDSVPYNLFVDHRKISWDDIDQTIINDGDKLALFLLVVGG